MFSFPPSQELYAHIDCDCFFASCEMMRDPKLRDKCVCVGGDIVLTSNYEARKYGVKLGVARWDAEKMIPRSKLVFLPPDMAFYGRVSDRMMGWLREHVLHVDVLGIDESWSRITGLPKLKGMDYEEYAYWLRRSIWQNIGVPASVGIASTRLRSKMLSELDKPMGVRVALTDTAFWWHVHNLHYKEIPYIGPAYQRRLSHLVPRKTVGEFMDLDFELLRDLIGVSATNVWHELHGVSAFKLKDPYKHEKSICATRSFNHQKTSSRKYLWEHLMMNFERAYRRLIEKNLETRYVGISFREKSGKHLGHHMILPDVTHQKGELLKQTRTLFDQLYSPKITYRGTGMYFSDLTPYLPKQYKLSQSQPVQQKQESNIQLERAINALNNKYGRQTVTHGTSSKVDPRYHREHLNQGRKKESVRRVRGVVDFTL